jgi:hypothetical protein
MEVGLDWILAVVVCPALVVRGLLYFLFIVATRGRVALIALAVAVASSSGVTDQRSITMVLRSQEHMPSGGHWMLPIKLHEHALGQVQQPLYLRIRWELLS